MLASGEETTRTREKRNTPHPRPGSGEVPYSGPFFFFFCNLSGFPSVCCFPLPLVPLPLGLDYDGWTVCPIKMEFNVGENEKVNRTRRPALF